MSETTTPDVVDGEVVEKIPAGAKKPQDRKPKQEKPAKKAKRTGPPTPAEAEAGEALRDVEFGSLEADEDGEPIPLVYTVDLMAMDDFDIYEAYERALGFNGAGQSMADMAATVTVMRAVLRGDEQLARWKAEQRAIHGRVTAQVMQEFLDVALTPGN